MKRWFVVYTKAAQERIAEINLKKQGFETYLPRLALRKKSAGRAISAVVPMFSRYLFVRLDLDAMPWRSVNGTFGVSNLVSFGERPAPVADAVVTEIMQRHDEDGVVRLSAQDVFTPGEKVEIEDGPLAEIKGLFTTASAKERVIVLMSMLGRDVPVRISPDRLRRAS